MNVTIIADASFCHITKAAGYGCWIATERGKRMFDGFLSAPEDNNVAESMAITNAIWNGLKSGLIREGDHLLIQSDSTSAINYHNGRDVPYNEQLKRSVEYVLELLGRYKLSVHYKHVKGHFNSEQGRYRAQSHCDNAARGYMEMARRAILEKDSELAEKFKLSVTPSKKKSVSKLFRSTVRRNHG